MNTPTFSACVAVVQLCACGVDGAAISVVEGDPPALQSWVGSQHCCGEDPHAVHGATTPDGAIVLVGKAAHGGAGTEGFVTLWRPPVGPEEPRFVDGDSEVVRASMRLGGDSALLQSIATANAIVAVGFRAAGPDATSQGIALVLDPTDLQVRAELELPPSPDGGSSVLESIALSENGRLALGGSWGFDRELMEGFKSYGNVVGGGGVVLTVDLAEVVTSGAGPTSLADLATSTLYSLGDVHSAKGLRWTPGDTVAVIGHDDEERSGLARVAPSFDSHTWTRYDDGIELTDLAIVPTSESDFAIAMVGHGGDDGINGHVKLADADGALLWAMSFGNPGVDESEVPARGLAPDKFVFDECWGIAVNHAGQLVAACGTGIEGCSAEFVEASSAERSRCRDDPRRVWRSYLVGISATGDVLWSRADAFVAEGEVAESAAEYLTVDARGDVLAVIDHGFGVGVARFGAE